LNDLKHNHVLAKTDAYAALTSGVSCSILFEILVGDLALSSCPDRHWDVGDNAKIARHLLAKSNLVLFADKNRDIQSPIGIAIAWYLNQQQCRNQITCRQ
jgi:cephalosporin hydroxylase